jgi:cytochrome c oxidase subunit 4
MAREDEKVEASKGSKKAVSKESDRPSAKGEKGSTDSAKASPKKKPADAKSAASAAPLAAKHHAPAAHAHAIAHGHAPNRREYMVIFAVLFVLTVLEVAVAQIPGIARILVGTALVALALTKAACVGLFYMHLKHETKVLKMTVAIPMATPMVYALILIAEAAWRLTR